MSEMIEKIAKQAVPEHLLDLDTLKDEVDESLGSKEKEPVKNDPRYEEFYTFHFSYKDGRGKLWEGDFTNNILTLKQQQAIGILRAKLAGGVSFDCLDPFTSEMNLIISHLTYSLSDRPAWAKDLLSMTNYTVLQAIYEEVASHEAMFFGTGNPETSG